MPCLHIDNLAYTLSFSSQRTAVSLFVWLTSPAFFSLLFSPCERFRAEVIDQHPLMTLYFPIHFANNFHCVDVSMPKRNPYGFQNPHELYRSLEATQESVPAGSVSPQRAHSSLSIMLKELTTQGSSGDSVHEPSTQKSYNICTLLTMRL